ncbi:MAG: riboflavin synthase [Chthoniobacterales bacterium]
MFTGLIEEVGPVIALSAQGDAAQLRLHAPRVSNGISPGASVAVNGCCLTVTGRNQDELTFDLLHETLSRTNLNRLAPGDCVNLERAIAAGAPLGGHFVQGHVDCAARIVALEEHGADLRVEIELPPEYALYVAGKGSIAVNGISLTVAEVRPESFAVWIIPHTRSETNLSAAKTGDLVNLEFDILAKYVERQLRPPTAA